MKSLLLATSTAFALAASPTFFKQTGTWTDRTGKKVELNRLEGKDTVVALFYATCPTICPMAVSNVKRIESALGDRAKKMQFVLISIDPDRDTTEALAQFAKSHGIEKNNWYVLRGPLDQVQKIAGSVDLGFSEKGAVPDIHQMHSLLIAAVDKKGKTLGNTSSMQPDVEKFVKLYK